MIRRLLSRKNNIKKIVSNNRGSAMITALVVGIIVFAFCLSMLLVAYTLFAQVSRNQVQLGCKTLALSTAEALETMWNNDIDSIKENVNNGFKENNCSLCYMLSGTEAFDVYDVRVKFIKDLEDGSIEMTVECYKDIGNFRDVQSYIVHKELE